jgi:hypothetical protein|tara:strand:+ start:1315 stop:1482 length:168 start_codon:yes stop_codon:yes gene_type:complete
MSKRYTLQIEEDYEGDAFIKIPQDLLDELGWLRDDMLEYEEETDGSVILWKILEE